MNSRRDFIRFLSLSAITAGCSTRKEPQVAELNGLDQSTSDDLEIHPELRYDVLLKWGDLINQQGERFGMDADYVGLISEDNNNAFLWVNHEAIHPVLMTSNPRDNQQKLKERKEVGGSLLQIRRASKRSKWSVDLNSKVNRRFDANSKIPFSNSQSIQAAQFAMGTLANCAGGVTPWKTFLSCEENYDHYYGEREHEESQIDTSVAKFGWHTLDTYPPEHYGWVVEINPVSGETQKRVELGRFAHEGATCKVSRDQRVAVYMGDDKADECLYKYVTRDTKSFEGGKLYVADIDRGRWISLDIEDQVILRQNFKNQLEVNTYTRKAAKLLGATPLNRPEDIEAHPRTGDVYVALTNNKKRGDDFGSILRIREKFALHSSLEFEADVFLSGGPETGFACPDNLAFDPMGNLWMTTDISGKKIDRGVYQGFGNNGLFLIPKDQSDSPEVIRIATAPWAAEFTGPCFSPDGRTLFLSVQHPGEDSKSLDKLTSHWPDGGNTVPKSALVSITGPLLDRVSARSDAFISKT